MALECLLAYIQDPQSLHMDQWMIIGDCLKGLFFRLELAANGYRKSPPSQNRAVTCALGLGAYLGTIQVLQHPSQTRQWPLGAVY